MAGIAKTVTDVIVIGAGMAGLTAARSLTEQGCEVTVVDKGRAAGGRLSTRRDGELRFDHGAQYFTARDPAFQACVADWQAEGVVRRWSPRLGVIEGGALLAKAEGGTERYVGVPAMRSLARRLAAALPDCRQNWSASAIARDGTAWCVTNAQGERLTAAAVVVTAPPEQARRLLAATPLDGAVPAALRQVSMRPCWALMLELDGPLFAHVDAAFVNEGAFSWIASQRSKPGRPDRSAWVLHATPVWSAEHLEHDRAWITEALWDEARRLPGARRVKRLTAQAHRWRYSMAERPLEAGSLWSAEPPALAVAGDWCAGSRVEGAFVSGRSAAARVADFLAAR